MAKNTHPLKEVTEKTGKEERKVALADALKKIEKNFGKGAIMRMGEKADTQIKTVSTGSLALDTALGVGGYPRGRIVEIYGPESSGKTTVALHAVAEVQKEGGTAAYIDAENALDPEYAKHLGVNIDDLLLSQPDTGEQGLEIADALVTSGAVDLVVVDSVAALVPRAEIEGEMGDAHVGLQARLMSQALRKLSGSISKTKTIAIFINQIREKVGVMFGNPETTPGGRALKFYATIRLEVRRSEQIKDGTDIIGNRVKIKVVKNKVAPPFKVAEVDIMYGKGISRTGELLDMAVDKDIVDKSGSWYSYGADRIGQGRENAKQYLADHPDVESEIRIKVRQAYGISDAKDAEADQEKDAEAAKADVGKETTAAADKKAADAKAPATKPAAKASPDTKDVKETKDVKDTKDTKGKAKASAGEAIDIFDGSEK